MSEHHQPGRQRVDSVVHGLMSEHKDYKRMKTGDATWAKIDKLMNKPTTQLILVEVPKGVRFIHNEDYSSTSQT